eukprot:scaffold2645_cov96-Skeletonema_marinoi.AAC.4
MEDNVFCVGGVSEAFHGKYTTTCDDDEKTVMFRWHDCNTTDCSICDGEETILSGTWVTPLSVWDAPTEETCFDADMLPPYDPSWNTTTMSYRFIDDPSTYASIVVENSCISKSLALAGGISIVSLQLNSSDGLQLIVNRKILNMTSSVSTSVVSSLIDKRTACITLS